MSAVSKYKPKAFVKSIYPNAYIRRYTEIWSDKTDHYNEFSETNFLIAKGRDQMHAWREARNKLADLEGFKKKKK